MMTEAKEKTKRGRPASVMPAPLYAMYVQMFNDEISTRRGMLNKHYVIQGVGILRKMKERGISGIDFLLDPNKRRVPRQGILKELGHIIDQPLAERIALTICECEKLRHRTVRQYEILMHYCRLQGLTQYLPAIIKETVSDNNEETE